jgi:predicted PolB exonuclease-like 3'-5' exonuclease
MKPSVIVWDLETVPDLAGFAAANDLAGKSDAEIRAALGNKFPKHIYHTIVCIGALGCVRSERAKFGQIRECAFERQGLFVSS